MKSLLIILCILVFCYSKQSEEQSRYTLVYKDSVGIEVLYKEKYGIFNVDTGTILLEDGRTYVLIKRDMSKTTLIKENLNSVSWKKLK